jgi:hypothetical protein
MLGLLTMPQGESLALFAQRFPVPRMRHGHPSADSGAVPTAEPGSLGHGSGGGQGRGVSESRWVRVGRRSPICSNRPVVQRLADVPDEFDDRCCILTAHFDEFSPVHDSMTPVRPHVECRERVRGLV